jgi:regulatory protein
VVAHGDDRGRSQAQASWLELAYLYLGRRDRTVAEVRGHLEAKGAEPEAAEAAIGELIEQGYLDDARYAQRFAEDRRTLDGWGAERIEQRLCHVGVAPELAAHAAGPAGGEAELAAALALLRRRWPRPPADDRERDRALGLLVRRGYELDLAYDAVRAHGREAA